MGFIVLLLVGIKGIYSEKEFSSWFEFWFLRVGSLSNFYRRFV